MTLKALGPSCMNRMPTNNPDIGDEADSPRAKRQKTEEPDDDDERPGLVQPLPLPPDDATPQPETQASESAAVGLVLPPVSTNAVAPKRKYDAVTRTYKSSMYVDAFNLALDTVLAHESYLFSPAEAERFAVYRSLPYEAQHLYVRLFLRKTGAWFRVERLAYERDIADMKAAVEALREPEVGFADGDEDNIEIEEAARLLGVEELRGLTREMKTTAVGNKGVMLEALMKAAREQGGLRRATSGQLKLSFDKLGKYQTREKVLVRKILGIIGPCIRLNAEIATLFTRVHLVFYRSTEWTEKSLTTVILSRTAKRNFPMYIVSRTSSIFPTRDALLDFEAAIKLQSTVDDLLAEALSPGGGGIETLEKVKEIFDEVYPRWETLVDAETATTSSCGADVAAQERPYLRRFTAAWVLTRIVHKGVYVLGRFKSYAREHSVLTALLAQKFFHGARRGGWYTRKALIEENYMAALEEPTPSAKAKAALVKKWRQRALCTCETGLQDPQTHLIFHHDLQTRLLKLETRLRVPKRLQHTFSHSQLRAPTSRTMYGVRTNAASLGRKTLWLNPAAEGADCSVEEMCLAQYRAEGWQGYHCEGGLLRTLWALLFADVLFAYVPNVFEHAFQTAPLDLGTEAFYAARASEINHRLVEIANGHAGRIVQETWDRESASETCIVGLSWRSYTLDEILEIVDCWNSGHHTEALATVCKVFCEEYRQRAGGVPDLFLWRRRSDNGGGGGEIMFAEVKSENDRLSDTQRLWIHVLSTAGVRVELCAARHSDVVKDGDDGPKEEGEGEGEGRGRGRDTKELQRELRRIVGGGL